MPAGTDDAGGNAGDAAGATGSDAGIGDATGAHDAMPDAASAGLLSITATIESGSDLVLTTDGSADWIHWGYKATSTEQTSASGVDRMAGGNAISGLTTAPDGAFNGSPMTASWTNGDPDVTVARTSAGLFIRKGSTLQFTVAATTVKQTLHVYGLTQQCSSRLDVALSDNAVPAVSASKNLVSGFAVIAYTVQFAAASADQRITVTFSDGSDAMFPSSRPICGLMEATLQ